MEVKKQQLEPDMEQQTGPKSGKEYKKVVYCHPAYLTYMHNLCKWNYLYGGLSFFKIQVNYFMAQDYPKMHLMGEGPGAILNYKTFLSSLTDC